MEIKFETKFSLEENVFYIKNKKIKHAYIREIDIKVNVIRTTDTRKLSIIPSTTYYFLEDNYIGNPIISKDEDELFSTKEELIKSIE